ncbi:MAG: hypothetical protein EAZ24_03335 [Burkholderiales bacterium]|nr:MAG: hypothetical protein EAZ21_04115 [Betaproteobacteria bacterium]TAG82950.1 MAG: hypothetical protein EAZ24_03335 [Burkholderiales bacterium]
MCAEKKVWGDWQGKRHDYSDLDARKLSSGDVQSFYFFRTAVMQFRNKRPMKRNPTCRVQALCRFAAGGSWITVSFG